MCQHIILLVFVHTSAVQTE